MIELVKDGEKILYLSIFPSNHLNLSNQFSLIMKLAGTYDVLILPFLLDTQIVLDLLPLDWKATSNSTSPLLPIPADVLSSLHLPEIKQDQDGRPTQHLILLQLGYQHGAGPGPYFTRFMMNFGEAKIDVPFLRHPSLIGKKGLEDKPFSLKQVV